MSTESGAKAKVREVYEKGVKEYNEDPFNKIFLRTQKVEEMTCYPQQQISQPTFDFKKVPEPKQTCSGMADIGGSVSGSIIDCRDRALRQQIPVVGTPFSLNYSSRENPESKANRIITYSINNFVPPAGYAKIKQVNIQTHVTDRVFKKVYEVDAPMINEYNKINHTVDWDGKKLDGTIVDGEITGETYLIFLCEKTDGSQVEFSKTIPQVFTGKSSIDRFIFNGWTISDYHRLDVATGTVYSGVGLRMNVNKSTALSLKYDQAGNILVPSEDSAGIYLFSPAGLHLKTLDAVTGVTQLTFEHDSSQNLSVMSDRYGKRTTLQRDVAGNLISITSPNNEVTNITTINGMISSIQDPLGRTNSFTYGMGDNSGLMVTFKNPKGIVKTYSFDDKGLLVSATDFNGNKKEFIEESSAGASEVRHISPLQRITKYKSVFDDVGNVFFENEYPDGSRESMSTFPESLSMNMVTKEGNNEAIDYVSGIRFPERPILDGHKTVTPAGLTSVFSLSENYIFPDPNDKTNISGFTKNVNLEGIGSYQTVFDKETLTYSTTTPMGRGSRLSLNVKGDVAFMRIGNLVPIRYFYDAQGRLKQLKHGERTYNYTYNGRDLLTSVTNPIGETTTFTYNRNRQIKTQTLPNGQIVSFGYDLNGNQSRSILPESKSYSYRFDKKDQLVSTIEPKISDVGFRWMWEYSVDDEITKITHPDTSLVNISYDEFGRLSTIAGPGIMKRYSFDSKGMPEFIQSGLNQSIYYSWDGHLPLEFTWNGEFYAKVGFSWAPHDRLNAISIYDRPEISYTYTPDGDIASVNDLRFNYNQSNGLLTSSKIRQIGTKSTYSTYGETIDRTVSIGATEFYSESYARDALSRITAIDKTEGGINSRQEFIFDSVGQLTSVISNGLVSETYLYDSNGNRKTATGTEQYDEQDRLVSNRDSDFTYNRNGYLIKKVSKSNGMQTNYKYDNLGNLLQVIDSAGLVVDYEVDGEDRRFIRKVGGELESVFIYQDDLKPVAQLNADRSVRAIFAYGSRFNSPDLIIKGERTYRIVHDHLGSPVFVIDVLNKSVVQKLTYDTWGNVLSDSNPGFQPFGFAGGLYDIATGLIRFGSRDYDPTIGRWLNKDPIRFDGGWNLYGYVGNDPVNFVDPDGLKKKFVFSDGKLTLYGDFGSKLWEGPAKSGNSKKQPAPVGLYSVGGLRKNRTGGFSCSGNGGYSLDIEPEVPNGRSLLRIHPDGGPRGTAGCIGVTCSLNGGADELQKILYDLYDQKMTPAIDLEVLFK